MIMNNITQKFSQGSFSSLGKGGNNSNSGMILSQSQLREASPKQTISNSAINPKNPENQINKSQQPLPSSLARPQTGSVINNSNGNKNNGLLKDYYINQDSNTNGQDYLNNLSFNSNALPPQPNSFIDRRLESAHGKSNKEMLNRSDITTKYESDNYINTKNDGGNKFGKNLQASQINNLMALDTTSFIQQLSRKSISPNSRIDNQISASKFGPGSNLGLGGNNNNSSNQGNSTGNQLNFQNSTQRLLRQIAAGTSSLGNFNGNQINLLSNLQSPSPSNGGGPSLSNSKINGNYNGQKMGLNNDLFNIDINKYTGKVGNNQGGAKSNLDNQIERGGRDQFSEQKRFSQKIEDQNEGGSGKLNEILKRALETSGYTPRCSNNSSSPTARQYQQQQQQIVNQDNFLKNPLSNQNNQQENNFINANLKNRFDMEQGLMKPRSITSKYSSELKNVPESRLNTEKSLKEQLQLLEAQARPSTSRGNSANNNVNRNNGLSNLSQREDSKEQENSSSRVTGAGRGIQIDSLMEHFKRSNSLQNIINSSDVNRQKGSNSPDNQGNSANSNYINTSTQLSNNNNNNYNNNHLLNNLNNYKNQIKQAIQNIPSSNSYAKNNLPKPPSRDLSNRDGSHKEEKSGNITTMYNNIKKGVMATRDRESNDEDQHQSSFKQYSNDINQYISKVNKNKANLNSNSNAATSSSQTGMSLLNTEGKNTNQSESNSKFTSSSNQNNDKTNRNLNIDISEPTNQIPKGGLSSTRNHAANDGNNYCKNQLPSKTESSTPSNAQKNLPQPNIQDSSNEGSKNSEGSSTQRGTTDNKSKQSTTNNNRDFQVPPSQSESEKNGKKPLQNLPERNQKIPSTGNQPPMASVGEPINNSKLNQKRPSKDQLNGGNSQISTEQGERNIQTHSRSNHSITSQASTSSTNTINQIALVEEINQNFDIENLCKINVMAYAEVETLLFTLTLNNKVSEIIRACQNYINLISDENFDGLEQILNDTKGQRTIVKGFILQRIGVILMLNQALKSEETDDAQLMNIFNAIQYIHSNQILILELIQDLFPFEQDHKEDHKNQIQEVIQERLKVKRIHKKETPAEQCSVIRSHNDIISPIIQLILNSSDTEPYVSIKEVFDQIGGIPVSQATHIILEAFSQIIINLEEKMQKKSSKVKQEDHLLNLKPPFLPPLEESKKNYMYTLCLDLDETLVHFEEVKIVLKKMDDGGQFLVRPYAEQFLEEMAQYYEIVIFTAAIKDYADFILDIIDVNKVISYRLYRQHTVPNESGNMLIKDISLIGRDLSQSMIVDNLPDNFSQQHENGIFIQSWYGQPEDRALKDLIPLLREIVIQKVPDVRIALRKFRELMIQNIENGVEDPHLNLTLDL